MYKVLITGGAGFIGSHLAEKLCGAGFQAAVVDNLSSGSAENLPAQAGIRLYQTDILSEDLEAVFERERPDYVIHLAAQTSVIRSLENPAEDARQNVLGTVRVVTLCKKYQVKKILAASSAAIYGAPQYLPIDEAHLAKPISPYGLSKYVMEQYIRLCGVPYVIFRCANVYGPRQTSSKENGVIALFHRALVSKTPLTVFGDGTQTRDYVYVGDVAELYLRALRADIQNETINISTRQGTSVNALLETMKAVYGVSVPVHSFPPRPGEIKDSVLCNKKALALFGGFTFTPLKEGLELCAALVK